MKEARPVPAIIPAYKGGDKLKRCVKALERQTIPIEIFIRDNTHDNIYFTAAVNEGLKRFIPQGHDYLLTLNQDMYLEPDAVGRMLAFMEAHPQCGIAAPLQIHSQNPEYVVCAGGLEAFPLGRHLHGPLGEFREPIRLNWANGACMMFRREMIEEIGLLDRQLVFLCSDSDYCFTARSRGWEVWVVADARGVHDGGASVVADSIPLQIIKLQDVLRFTDKWLTGDLYRRLATPDEAAMPNSTVVEIRRKIQDLLVKVNGVPAE